MSCPFKSVKEVMFFLRIFIFIFLDRKQNDKLSIYRAKPLILENTKLQVVLEKLQQTVVAAILHLSCQLAFFQSTLLKQM